MTRLESEDAIRARLRACATAAGSTARVVAIRIDGALDELCGRLGDADAPRDRAELGARIASIRAWLDGVVARLCFAAGVGDDAVFRAGIDRAFLVCRSDDAAVDARLTEVRASLESELLAAKQGALAIVIAWTDAASEEIDSQAVASALEARLARRAATPFLDALSGEAPCGPFPVAATARAEPSEARTVPIAVALARRTRPSGGDLAAAIGAACAPLSTFESPALLRGSTAGGELAVGPFADVLAFAVNGEGEPAVAIDAARRESGLSGALARVRAVAASRGISVLGVRAPKERFAAAIALGEALAPLARSRTAAIAGLLEIAARIDEGGDRAPLLLLSRWRSRAHALAAGLGVDERAVRAHPEGSRAAAHESALDLEQPARAALKTLIREFPRWFDSGAARIPLWCALNAGERDAEVCSA